MKLFFLSLIISGCFLQTANGQGIKFTHNLDSALKQAKSENKLVFIDFYTSWCGPCKVMDKEIFPQEKAGDFYNAKFINCRVQCDDKGIGVKLGEKYKVVAYPTLMFLNGDGELVHSQAGSLSVDGLIAFAQTAMDPRKNLMSDIKKWEAGDREESFVLNYFKRLKDDYRYDKAKTDFLDYFFKLNQKDREAKNTFKLIKIVGAEPFKPLLNYVESNRKRYYKSAGKPEVDSLISQTYLSYLRSLAIHNPKEYEVAIERFKAKKYSYYDEFKMYCDVFLNEKIQGFMADGTKFLSKYGEKRDSYTLSLSSMLGNYTGRKNEGAAGITWMENLLKRNPDPKYSNVYFYILWRNYNFDKALVVGERIRLNDIKNGQSTEEIDKQIKMINDLKIKYQEKNH